jgi:oligopeptide transport system substrate-binding protein
MAHNTLKYKRIDPLERQKFRREWNKPIVWPVLLLLAIIAVSLVPAVLTYRRKEHVAAVKQAEGN